MSAFGTGEAEQKSLPSQWAKLLDRLAADYPLIRRTPDWICLGWPSERPTMPQTVQVKCMVIQEKMRVLVTADLCKADGIPPQDALDVASHLLVGGVISHRGLLSIRQIFTEGHFDVADIDATINWLRNDATNVRNFFRERLGKKAALHFDTES